MWYWTAALVLASTLSLCLGFVAGCFWQSSVGRWPAKGDYHRDGL